MPYADDDARRAAKREQARRRRSRPRDGVGPVGPGVGPDDPRDAPTSGNGPAPAAPATASVGPGVGPAPIARGVDALLDVALDELAVVRSTRTDPLARGRVVSTLINTAITATRAAETAAQVAELAETVAQLKAERDHHRPRRLHAT